MSRTRPTLASLPLMAALAAAPLLHTPLIHAAGGPVVLSRVDASARAITLKFPSPGASAYEVRYRTAASAADCTTDPASWTLAPRSANAKPLAEGTTEYFAVRPLTANQAHCVAIRAQNLGVWSAWTLATGPITTSDGLGGGWSFELNDALSNSQQVVPRYELVYAGEPVVGWVPWDNSLGGYAPSGSFSWQSQRASYNVSTLVDRIDALEVAANPGAQGAVAALLGGRRLEGTGRNRDYVNRYVLVEASSPTATPVVTTIAAGRAITGGVDADADGALTYVQRGGTWTPTATIDRVITKTTSTKVSGLYVTERTASGWLTETNPVLSRSGATEAAGYYSSTQLLALPSATPGHSALALVAPHCGMTVYAERAAGINGSWTYYDAGPMPSGTFMGGRPLQLVWDPVDAEAVLMWKPTYDGSSPMLVARRSAFRLLPGRPSTNCAQVVPDATIAREAVAIGSNDPGLTNQGAGGILELGGATFAAVYRSEPNNKAKDVQLLYRCTASEAWQTRQIDAPHFGAAAPELAGDGGMLVAYPWGMSGGLAGGNYLSRPADVIYVAGEANPCPGN